MTVSTMFRACCVLVSLVLLFPASASADPIAGLTYTYDLSEADSGSGAFTTAFAPAWYPTGADDTVDNTDLSLITSKGMLTDGELGSTDPSDPGTGCCMFDNGTYAGFQNVGSGGVPQPKIDVDLGGTYQLNTFTLHYLVEDGPWIFAPQPIPDGSGGNLFDALTVSGSSDGTNYSVLGFSNDFNPLDGPFGDQGTGVAEVRTATIDLTGNTMSYLSIDVRTPYSYIFLSEVVVDGVAATGMPGDFDGDDDVDGADFLLWQRDTGIGDLAVWQDHFGDVGSTPSVASVPEPSSAGLLALVVVGLVARSRRTFRSIQ